MYISSLVEMQSLILLIFVLFLYRLGAMWAGVEPEEGYINQPYVNILKEIVNSYGEEGIYTILDMHQDVLWQG